jgi:predicted metal-dependent phosphoesterase TrpH
VRANPEAIPAAKQAGIACLPGVELDCVYKGLNFHVLGYGISDAGGDFTAIDEDMERQYKALAMESLHKTRAMGFDVTVEEMQEVSKWSIYPDRWTGERFGEVLLNKPEYADHPLFAPYRPGGSRSDNPYISFYWDFYSQGKPCYVEMQFPPMQRAVELIHDNGGAVVLAHPGNNLKGHEELFGEIMNLGFEGVEAFSSYHSAEQSARFCRMTREMNRFCTIGSDYHGRLKPAIFLGKVGFPEGIERTEIEKAARSKLEKYCR